jgi:hypothetical protein
VSRKRIRNEPRETRRIEELFADLGGPLEGEEGKKRRARNGGDYEGGAMASGAQSTTMVDVGHDTVEPSDVKATDEVLTGRQHIELSV